MEREEQQKVARQIQRDLCDVFQKMAVISLEMLLSDDTAEYSTKENQAFYKTSIIR